MGWLGGVFRWGAAAACLVLGSWGCDAAVDICGDDAVPVCGADMVLYGDYCAAGAAGVEVIAVGGCPCEPVTCEIACPFGFATGANGCEECRCNDGPVDAGTDAGEAFDAGVDGGVVVDPDSGTDAYVPPEDATIVCPEGMMRCDDVCVAPDIFNCGGCGVECGDVDHTTYECVDSVCVPHCEEGFEDCLTDVPGCETFLEDPDHCGACGRTCPGPEDGPGVATCGYNDASGRTECGVDCEGDHLHCDGACVDPYFDRENCGGCGTVCGAFQECVGFCRSAEYCNNPGSWTRVEDDPCTWRCGRFTYTRPGAGTTATCSGPRGGRTCDGGDGECGPNLDCCSPAAFPG